METAWADAVRWARDISRSLLTSLPDRWAHTQGVARRARTLAPVLGTRTEIVETAAWLHDIGYSPALIETGFHPLDGARFLRDGTEPREGGFAYAAGQQDTALHELTCAYYFTEEVISLVAHHSWAAIEADERGLLDVLNTEFPSGAVDIMLLSALTYADLTTSPLGRPVTVDERLVEILTRYPPEDPVHRAVLRARPLAQFQCHSVEELLTGAPTAE